MKSSNSKVTNFFSFDRFNYFGDTKLRGDSTGPQEIELKEIVAEDIFNFRPGEISKASWEGHVLLGTFFPPPLPQPPSYVTRQASCSDGSQKLFFNRTAGKLPIGRELENSEHLGAELTSGILPEMECRPPFSLPQLSSGPGTSGFEALTSAESIPDGN
ncbi:hypothetical protein RUM43_006573 [Polyplax serrata]|uniref:Uncharacterized protein n=1 Tax=Polyplax serrata TaxID=468196 RepID=A0AAN8PBN7_POLSC